jgi:hypothetical protein
LNNGSYWRSQEKAVRGLLDTKHEPNDVPRRKDAVSTGDDPARHFIDAIADAVAARVSGLLGGHLSGIRPRLLSVEDAGRYISRSPAGVRKLITDGKLPTVPLDSRIFIDIQDLDRVIEQAKTKIRVL